MEQLSSAVKYIRITAERGFPTRFTLLDYCYLKFDKVSSEHLRQSETSLYLYIYPRVIDTESA
jgi:hypothetical protein